MMHAASIGRSPRLRRVADFLADGAEHSTLEIAIGAQVCAVNSCVAELRANGYEIDCRQATGGVERIWLYRLSSKPECQQ